MIAKEKIKILHIVKGFDKIIITFIFSILLFVFSAYFNNFFTEIMSVATYLTWHNLFEFASILASFSIFIVTYYIYEESKKLRMIVVGCAFLLMGSLDIFHTLSYKGMADFFIPNTCANRATTFWILSRSIGSIVFLTATFIPRKTKSNINRYYFVYPTSVLVIALLLIVTYYPNFFPPMFIEGQGLTNEKIFMEYMIIILMIITFVRYSISYKQYSLKQDYLCMLAILYLILSEFAFLSYGSVYDAYNYIGHIYKTIAYFILFKAIYADNVIIPYREMNRTKNELKEYSENLNILVKQRTKELEEINGILMMDIEYAREMQSLLLPAYIPQDSLVSFNAGYFPAERLSGDFYNIIKLDENNIAIYIGDVSGHGVSAAMLTMFANQNIKPIKQEDEEHHSDIEIISPGYVLKSLYKTFNKTNFKVETYIVMLYGIYNTKSKCFTYASGGINVKPIIIKKSGEILDMNLSGFPICKFGDVFMPFYENETIQLQTG
ncbi:MAG: rsbU, partial [Bacillota bacterium]|nr:rsbU [Bacillota bacterium]